MTIERAVLDMLETELNNMLDVYRETAAILKTIWKSDGELDFKEISFDDFDRIASAFTGALRLFDVAEYIEHNNLYPLVNRLCYLLASDERKKPREDPPADQQQSGGTAEKQEAAGADPGRGDGAEATNEETKAKK